MDLCSTQTTSYGGSTTTTLGLFATGLQVLSEHLSPATATGNKISVFVAQLVPHEPKNLLSADGDVERFYGKIHIPWKNGASSPVTRDGPTKHSDHDGGKLEVAGTGEQPSTREPSPFLPVAPGCGCSTRNHRLVFLDLVYSTNSFHWPPRYPPGDT